LGLKFDQGEQRSVSQCDPHHSAFRGSVPTAARKVGGMARRPTRERTS
jgi:hypothetical protein